MAFMSGCMRGKWYILFFVTVILHLLVPEHKPATAEGLLPFRSVRIVISGDGSPGPYETGQAFIGGTALVDSSSAPDSIRVLSSDPQALTITFDRPLAAGDSAAVTMAVPPSWFKSSYKRPQSKTPGMGISAPEYDAETYRKKTPRSVPGLKFGGSKTFDVNVGSESEVALNQTLRLNISGHLTDDITLNAAISDQNIPISPEGDTRELEELDRVLIELKGPGFTAEMGDTDLRRQSGRWLSYERRLSGARVSVEKGGVTVHASGAAAEGRHMSITITPVEGNQGPYRLITESGMSTISIIPGSETIWINGEELTRGSSYDYTIDYTTGEITFTERRIIGSDLRIVCDYEYTSDSWMRNFYSGGADGSFFDGKLTFGIIAAREADNKDKPILYDLDNEIKQALAAAGDSAATIDGISPAEDDTSGTYDIVDGHLVYNAAGEGGYSATFSWVGEDEGSYKYLGGGIYEWVEPDNRVTGSGASYEPVTTIDGPVSSDLAGITLSLDPVPYVHFETELAGSKYDQNTRSSLDDEDNDGDAKRFGVAISPTLKRVPVKLDINGSHRSNSKTFTPLDRDRTAEENREWGLPLVSGHGSETVTEYSGGVSVASGSLAGTGVSFNTGSAEFGDASVDRHGGAGYVRFRDRASADISFSHIAPQEARGDIDRTRLRATGILAGFTPAVSWEREEAENAYAESYTTAYDDYEAHVLTPALPGGFTSELSWQYRDERKKVTAWEDSSLVRGGSIGVTSPMSATGSFRAQYSRRKRETGPDEVKTDQAVMEWMYRPDGGLFEAEGTYSAGRSREASKRKNYIYVGTGRGSYRWEDEDGDGIRDQDEFIPDPLGDYYLYEETLSDYKPVNAVNLYSRFGLEIPAELLRWIYRGMPDIASETTFEVNEKSTASTGDIFLLNLKTFRKKGKTTSGDARIQQDVTVPVSGGSGSARLRYFRYDALNAEYTTGAERRGDEELSLRLRLPISEGFDTETTVASAAYNRTMDQQQTGNYRVQSYSGDTAVSFYPSPKVTFSLSVGGGIDNDGVSSLDATYVEVEPSAIYRFSGRGRLEGSYGVTTVRLGGNSEGKSLPYTMARGWKEGTNQNIKIAWDYRLSQRMNLIMSYTGRQFGGGEFEHYGQAQMRAMF